MPCNRVRLVGWFCLGLGAGFLGTLVYLSGRKFPPTSFRTFFVLLLLTFLCAFVGHGLLQRRD